MAFGGTTTFVDGTVLYRWMLTESEDELKALCEAEGMPCDCHAGAAGRRKEMLAERLLMKRIFGIHTPIEHNDDRKPFVADSNLHITITHARGLVGIAINHDHPIGIDVEHYRDQVLKVRRAFLSAEEQEWLASDDLVAHLIAWTTKEAIFKAVSKRDLVGNYREDIVLKKFSTPHIGEEIIHTGHFKGKDFYLHTELSDDYVTTFTCEKEAQETSRKRASKTSF